MTKTAEDSKRIATWLQARNLGEIAAFFFEAARPLSTIGAQLAFLAAPLIGGREGPLHDLGCIMENPERMSEILDHLKQEKKEND